ARGEPRVHRIAEPRLAAEARGKRDLAQLDPEAVSELAQRAELVQLAGTVQSVSGRPAARNDEPAGLEVAEHPRRPAGHPRSLGDGVFVHERNLTTSLSMSRSSAPPARR